MLLKPLPYNDPDRIVRLSNVSPTVTSSNSLSRQVSIPDFEDWRALGTSFEAMAYYGSRDISVMPGALAEYARAARVSQDFCRVFAVEPVLGRLFSPDEMKAGSGGALLISYAVPAEPFRQRPERPGQIHAAPREGGPDCRCAAAGLSLPRRHRSLVSSRHDHS